MVAPHGALGPERSTDVRALAASAIGLALCKPDITFAAKELYKCFAAPNRRAALAVKRLAKYLAGRLRLVWHVRVQLPTSRLTNACGTDITRCIDVVEREVDILSKEFRVSWVMFI